MKRKFKYFPGINLLAKFTPLCSSSKSVVVFVPGYFSASSIGPNRIFVEIEDALVDKCGSAYRLDWPGMGDNSGCLSDYTFSELADQLGKKLAKAIKDLKEERKVTREMLDRKIGPIEH